MPEITITELVHRSHALAVSKGWHDTWPDGKTKQHAVNVPEKLALIHSEISEALEEYRRDDVRIRCSNCNGSGEASEGETCPVCAGRQFVELWLGEKNKPEGFIVELADAVIRIADLCGALGLDLASAIEVKHQFNATREFRHGGKRA